MLSSRLGKYKNQKLLSDNNDVLCTLKAITKQIENSEQILPSSHIIAIGNKNVSARDVIRREIYLLDSTTTEENLKKKKKVAKKIPLESNHTCQWHLLIWTSFKQTISRCEKCILFCVFLWLSLRVFIDSWLWTLFSQQVNDNSSNKCLLEKKLFH